MSEQLLALAAHQLSAAASKLGLIIPWGCPRKYDVVVVDGDRGELAPVLAFGTSSQLLRTGDNDGRHILCVGT